MSLDESVARLLKARAEAKANFPHYNEVSPEERGQIRKRKMHAVRQRLVCAGYPEIYPRQSKLASTLCASAQKRALVYGIPCTITADWILERLIIGKCEVTGLAFDFTPPRQGKGWSRGNFAPSVDRKVPELGYTKENARVVIWGYNSAKSTGTDEDVMVMAEALVRRKAEKNGSPS